MVLHPFYDPQPADPVLSQIAITHENNDVVGKQLAPDVIVQDDEGKFPMWGLEAFNLEQDTLRAPRTKANAVEFGYTWFPFDLEEHALDFEYAHEEKKKYDRMGERIGNTQLFNLQRDGVKSTEDRLQLRREKKIGDTLRALNVPGEILASAQRWDQAGTDIPSFARRARNSIHRRSGKIMNTVLLPFAVDDIVLWAPSMKEYLGGNERKFVDVELIKRIFRVENVITAAAVYNQGGDGIGNNPPPDFADVWERDVIFCYVNPNGTPTRREMSFAYNFRYGLTNNEGATPSPVQGEDQSMPVTAWYDANTETHLRRVKYREKARVVSPACGYVVREAINPEAA